MKKGFINFLEIVIVAGILILAFLHFFPQYKIETEWDTKLLEIELRDTLITIDRLNQTQNFSTNLDYFNDFMGRIYSVSARGNVYVWWRNSTYPSAPFDQIPFYTRGTEKSIVDVVNDTSGFRNYTLTVGIGTPY